LKISFRGQQLLKEKPGEGAAIGGNYPSEVEPSLPGKVKREFQLGKDIFA
jgi:hypothetical protein